MLKGVESVGAVIALADGDNNSGNGTMEGVIGQAVDIGIPVYTVGIESSTFVPDTLIAIADATGGTYSGGDAADLTAIFNEIRQRVEAQYRLTFTSRNVERTDNQRLVQVQVSHDGETAIAQQTYRTEPPDADLGLSPWMGQTNDPVSTATGNFIQDTTDLRVRTPGLPLVFRRFYNSQDDAAGPLGRGWTHNFNVALTEDDGQEDRVSIRWEDGRKDYWLQDTGRLTATNLGNYGELSENGSGWVCRLKSLVEYYFDRDGRLERVVDRNGNAIEMTYASGRLESAAHSLGKGLTFAYDGDGFLEGVTEDLGDAAWEDRSLAFSYQDGLLTAVTGVTGQTTAYGYDSPGRMTTVTDPRGVTTVQNEYDDRGRVTRQWDAEGNCVDLAYDTPETNQTTITSYLTEGGSTRSIATIHRHDGLARLFEVIYPNQESVQFDYSGNSNRDLIEDRNGNARTFSYDLDGNVTAISAPDDSMVRLVYNDLFLPVRAADAAGYITEWEYDEYGNLLQETRWLDRWKTEGANRQWTYNDRGQVLTAVDERDITVAEFTYDDDGRPAELEDAEGNTAWFAYDAAGRLVSTTGPRGAAAGDQEYTTSYTYDEADRVVEVQSPAGAISYEYDAAGNTVRVTNARGYATEFEYDGNGAVTVVHPALGAHREFQYDALNRLSVARRIGTADEERTQYRYDDLGRVTAVSRMIEAGDILLSEYGYDANGNLLSAVSPAGTAVSTVYDSMNRPISMADAVGNIRSMAYDVRGLQTDLVDPLGNRTGYEYDALRRLTGVQEPRPDGGDTAYTYDEADNLTLINNTRGIDVLGREYDNRGLLQYEHDGIGNTHEYAYDAAGNLTEAHLANGNVNVLNHDGLNRLTGVDYGDGTAVTYAYDANGNLTAMTGPGTVGESTFEYDALDRLNASTDGFGKRVEYEYGEFGNRTALVYPDGKRVAYEYDLANRLVAIEDWAGRRTTYAYHGELMVCHTFPNGVSASYGYDAAGRLISIVYRKVDETELLRLEYTRDGNGAPTRIDKAGTLDYELEPEDTHATFDDDNRILQAGNIQYTHDANGNLTQSYNADTGVTTTFTYNAADRVTRYDDGTTIVEHIYDAKGYRVARIEDGVETRYVLDHGRSMSQVLAETDAAGAFTAYYLHGPRLVGRIAASGAQRYYLTDDIGNVLALTDENGDITDRYAYTPYGVLAAREGTTENPFTFVGGHGVMQEPGGLYFMRARFYQSKDGRFESKDAMGPDVLSPSTFHGYTYGTNAPNQWIDASGYCTASGTVSELPLLVYWFEGEPTMPLEQVVSPFGASWPTSQTIMSTGQYDMGKRLLERTAREIFFLQLDVDTAWQEYWENEIDAWQKLHNRAHNDRHDSVLRQQYCGHPLTAITNVQEYTDYTDGVCCYYAQSMSTTYREAGATSAGVDGGAIARGVKFPPFFGVHDPLPGKAWRILRKK